MAGTKAKSASKANVEKEREVEVAQAANGAGSESGGKDFHYKVKFTSFPDKNGIKGICSVTLNDAFAVKGVKVVEGSKGLFMALPSYKAGDEYKDVCHPVTAEGRKSMSEAVLNAYTIQSEEHAQNIGAAGMTEGEGISAPEGVPMNQGNGIGQA